MEDAIDDALASHPDNGDLLAAVVLEANARKIVLAEMVMFSKSLAKDSSLHSLA